MNRFQFNAGFATDSTFPNYPEPFDDLDYDLIDPTDILLLDEAFFVELEEAERKGLVNSYRPGT